MCDNDPREYYIPLNSERSTAMLCEAIRRLEREDAGGD